MASSSPALQYPVAEHPSISYAQMPFDGCTNRGRLWRQAAGGFLLLAGLAVTGYGISALVRGTGGWSAKLMVAAGPVAAVGSLFYIRHWQPLRASDRTESYLRSLMMNVPGQDDQERERFKDDLMISMARDAGFNRYAILASVRWPLAGEFREELTFVIHLLRRDDMSEVWTDGVALRIATRYWAAADDTVTAQLLLLQDLRALNDRLEADSFGYQVWDKLQRADYDLPRFQERLIGTCRAIRDCEGLGDVAERSQWEQRIARLGLGLLPLFWRREAMTPVREAQIATWVLLELKPLLSEADQLNYFGILCTACDTHLVDDGPKMRLIGALFRVAAPESRDHYAPQILDHFLDEDMEEQEVYCAQLCESELVRLLETTNQRDRLNEIPGYRPSTSNKEEVEAV